MSTRAQVLDLAILGLLQRGPVHGYAIRKRLSLALGPFRTLSYGSLYPALRGLTERGLIEAAEDPAAHGLGRRSRIVYHLTDAGRAHLRTALASSDPSAWEDDAFDVRFSLFGTTDPATRLQILEGRRARMLERLENLRSSTQRAMDRMDAYTSELARHGLEQVEREVDWLERVIDTERGTPGALDYGALTQGHGTPHDGDPPARTRSRAGPPRVSPADPTDPSVTTHSEENP